MNKQSKIHLAGHLGLVGSSIHRKLQENGFRNFLLRSIDELDLTSQTNVEQFYAENKPEYVILAAALVGGIQVNNQYPADFIRVNLQIYTNIIDAAFRYGVKKLLFLGSSCIYPKLAPQPISEEYFMTGPLEITNEGYATAKIAGIKMCQAYLRQHSFKSICLMPTNLYGPGDNFDLKTSHVLPAFIRKFHEAVESGRTDVEIWGTGKPLREFMHVDDLADAVLFLMQYNYEELMRAAPDTILNVGVGEDISIRRLAELVAEVIEFKGELSFNPAQPDGTPRKLLDVSRLNSLGWKAKILLREGIQSTYQWYRENISHWKAIRGGV